MVKCPKCNKEIDYLEYSKECISYGRYVNEEFEEYACEFVKRGEELFECPKCKELLFEDETEANDFLNSESLESD